MSVNQQVVDQLDKHFDSLKNKAAKLKRPNREHGRLPCRYLRGTTNYGLEWRRNQKPLYELQ